MDTWKSNTIHLLFPLICLIILADIWCCVLHVYIFSPIPYQGMAKMCWDRLGVCQPWKCEWTWPPEASSALGRCSGASQRSHWPPGKPAHSGAEWSAPTQSLPGWRTSLWTPASRHRGNCLTHTHPHTADKYTYTQAFEERNFKPYQCDWRTGQSWWSPPQSLKPGNKRQRKKIVLAS